MGFTKGRYAVKITQSHQFPTFNLDSPEFDDVSDAWLVMMTWLNRYSQPGSWQGREGFLFGVGNLSISDERTVSSDACVRIERYPTRAGRGEGSC